MTPNNSKRIKPLLPLSKPLTEAQARDGLRQNEGYHSRSARRTVTEITVAALIVIGGSVAYYYGTRLPFDSKRWQAHKIEIQNAQGSVRERMWNDLSPRLQGRSRSEIIQMLGPSATDRNASSLRY